MAMILVLVANTLINPRTMYNPPLLTSDLPETQLLNKTQISHLLEGR